MNPEEQHRLYQQEAIYNIMRGAQNMARCRFTLFHNAMHYDFKVWMEIWQDDDFDYVEFQAHCKKIAQEHILINNNKFKAHADELYRLLATEMPGRETWISINSGDVGLHIKYQI